MKQTGSITEATEDTKNTDEIPRKVFVGLEQLGSFPVFLFFSVFFVSSVPFVAVFTLN